MQMIIGTPQGEPPGGDPPTSWETQAATGQPVRTPETTYPCTSLSLAQRQR